MKFRFFLVSIFLLIVLISSVSYFYFKKSSSKESKISLKAIAQTGFQKEALKTDDLADILDLSVEEPYCLNKQEIKKKLLNCPLIETAEVEKVDFDILWIDYQMRRPYVFLANYFNIALDRKGYPFPFSPFHTPKNMPRLLMSHVEVRWNYPIKHRQLPFEILTFLEKKIPLFKILVLDVENAYQLSLGKREVVVVIQGDLGKHYLRLNPRHYQDEIRRYLCLSPILEEGDKVIDLRLPKLAYIKSFTSSDFNNPLN